MSEESEASKEVHGPCLFRPMVEELRALLSERDERVRVLEGALEAIQGMVRFGSVAHSIASKALTPAPSTPTKEQTNG